MRKINKKRKVKIAKNNIEKGSFDLFYPIIAVHQLYVGELFDELTSGFGDGLFIPKWLFEKAGLENGEKLILTREKCGTRHAEYFKNRTVAPVFFWNKNYVRAVGPTARFLGKTGPSCFIVYGCSKNLDNITGIDLNFPFGNTKNGKNDLQIRLNFNRDVTSEINKNIYRRLSRLEREVLIAQFSGLIVKKGDPYCNPSLAQIPQTLIKNAGLPLKNIEAYFSNNSKSSPALKSYVVPSEKQAIVMSGALFGAFPAGDEFVINIYGRIK